MHSSLIHPCISTIQAFLLIFSYFTAQSLSLFFFPSNPSLFPNPPPLTCFPFLPNFISPLPYPPPPLPLFSSFPSLNLTFHPFLSHPLLSSPLPSHPLLSSPLPSHPLPSHPLLFHPLFFHPSLPPPSFPTPSRRAFDSKSLRSRCLCGGIGRNGSWSRSFGDLFNTGVWW